MSRYRKKDVAGQALRPQTQMMSFGYDPALSEGSIKPPLFQTSTFAFKSAEDGKRQFALRKGLAQRAPGEEFGLVYSRFNNPNLEILEDRLAIWEQAEKALVFASGMAAISSTLLALSRPGDVVMNSEPLYGGTEGLLLNIFPQFGIGHAPLPVGTPLDQIEALMRAADEEAAKKGGRLSAIMLETPANPTNELTDIVGVVGLAKKLERNGYRPAVCVDNTFLGPLWSRPLDHGADIVVYSLTKYVGGHSDLVAGSVSGAKKWIDPVRMLRNTMGGIADPNTAWMLLRSLETVELRMTRAGENAAKVCAFAAKGLETGDIRLDDFKLAGLARQLEQGRGITFGDPEDHRFRFAHVRTSHRCEPSKVHPFERFEEIRRKENDGGTAHGPAANLAPSITGLSLTQRVHWIQEFRVLRGYP